MLLGRQRASEEEGLVMQNRLAVHVLHLHVEHEPVLVDGRIEAEVGTENGLDAEQAPRDRLDVRLELQLRELVHEEVEHLAHFRHLHELAEIGGAKVVVPLPGDGLLLELPEDHVGHLLELSERRLGRPAAPLHHVAELQHLVGELRPASLQGNLEQRAQDACSRLMDVGHVGQQREALKAQAADVRLHQGVDLGAGLLQPFLDRNRHPLRQLLQLQLLVLPDVDLGELRAEAEEPQDLNVAHLGSHVLIVRRHGLVRDVVVGRHPAQRRALEDAGAPVVLHQLGLLQQERGRVHQVRPALPQDLVPLHLRHRDAIEGRIAKHADVEIRVPQPLHRLGDVLHAALHDLRVQIVGELRDHLRLHRQLLVHQGQVVLQLGMLSDDDAFSLGVILRPARAAEHLLHVQRAELDPFAFLWIVHLRPLDDHRVRRQVDAPRQGRRTDEHLDMLVGKEILHEVPVRPCQARVVDREAIGQNLLEVFALGGARLRLLEQHLLGRRVLSHDLLHDFLVDGHLLQGPSGLDGVRAGVHEDEHLVLPRLGHHLLEANLVHELEALQRLLLGDADVLLLQRNGTEAVVEEEQAGALVRTEEGGDVPVVWKRGRQPDDPHTLLGELRLPQGSRDQRFQHGATIVVQQVDLVDDDQPNELRVGAVSALSRDDVPLLRRRHDDLRICNLGLRQALVSAELLDLDAVVLQALPKVHHHFLNKRLHGSNVDDLERVKIVPVHVLGSLRGATILPNDVQHAHHGAVGLTTPRGRAEQQVSRSVQRRLLHLRLDAVQPFHALEGGVRPLRKLGQRNEPLVCPRLMPQRRHMDFFVSLLLSPPRLCRKLAGLVAHQVAALMKAQVAEVQDAFGPQSLGDGVGSCVRNIHVILSGAAALVSQRSRFAPRLPAEVSRPLHLPLVRGLCLPERGENVRPAELDVLAHFVLDGASLVVALRLAQPGAVVDRTSVSEQNLDEVELLEAQDRHEPVLASTLVADRERTEDLLRDARALVGIVVVSREAPLEPVCVDVARPEDAQVFLIVLVVLVDL
mmetsp:Transcript_8053/g.30236  ORF Transcript_8053/g.30236 Transcript_8053/m.30236 type:complete len:1031 (+) Transcript_8053:3808-6900(+)